MPDGYGGTVGVGLEYGFAPNWSFGVEYDHLFMGNRNLAMYSTGAVGGLPAAGILVATDRVGQDVDLFSVRLNYKFGLGKGPVGKGPVTARYLCLVIGLDPQSLSRVDRSKAFLKFAQDIFVH